MTIKVENISKAYKDLVLMDKLNLEFNTGLKYCILGVSGSGKTQLLRMIAGLIKPDSGKITMDEKKISFCFQENRLIEHISGLKNVSMVCEEKTAIEILKKLGLSEKSMKKPVRYLSGGMKRRVAIARALGFGGDLYIFDEPFTGLDEKAKINAANVIKEYTKDKTVILTTHDKEMLEIMADTVYEFTGPPFRLIS